MSWGIFGIQWEEIDGDISYESFEYENPELMGISRIFFTDPELNTSTIVRRLGIQQSLLAQYIRGVKKQSPECEQMILEAIKEIGSECCGV